MSLSIAALVATWATACADDCDDSKCAPHTCVTVAESELQRPEAYSMSADDVLLATEGLWVGEKLSVQVERRSGDATFGELQGSNGGASEAAWMDCASLRVPATVAVSMIDEDGGVQDTDIYESITVFGPDLAMPGDSPRDRLELSYSGQYLAFPTVGGLHFGLDGSLWRIRDVKHVEQVGVRQDGLD